MLVIPSGKGAVSLKIRSYKHTVISKQYSDSFKIFKKVQGLLEYPLALQAHRCFELLRLDLCSGGKLKKLQWEKKRDSMYL